jgi:periplasmic protein TonB
MCRILVQGQKHQLSPVFSDKMKNESIVPHKDPSADLHRKSPWIFLISLAISLVLIVPMLFFPFHNLDKREKNFIPAPVIITLQNIPEPRQVVRTPVPPKPFIPSAQPVAAPKAVEPEAATISDTKLDREAVPQAPSAILVPEKGGADTLKSAPVEDKSIYDYLEVKDPPKRLKTVIPEYPEMASRAGIEGTVYLKVLVNSKGFVDSVEVQRGPKIFQNPAIKAAQSTLFSPARQNNKAVACWVILSFRFVKENKN